jgi:chemotaxis protein methyltransferase CheR
MSTPSLDNFYALVENHVGLLLDDSKYYLIESRLSDISQRAGHSSIQDFVKHLLTTPVGQLHEHAFEALLTNETSFFRDKALFDALEMKILPSLIEKRRTEKTLRINCLAASTGQEVYSLCMLIKDRFPELSQWTLYIQASDFSVSALESAKSGIYNQREIERGLNQNTLNKYFTRLPNGSWQIAPSLRQQVNFFRQNLLDECPSYPKFDLVMLRNVLIYFRQEVKNKILKQVHRCLHPDGGVLLLGSTESIHANSQYQLVPLGRVSYYVSSTT